MNCIIICQIVRCDYVGILGDFGNTYLKTLQNNKSDKRDTTRQLCMSFWTGYLTVQFNRHGTCYQGISHLSTKNIQCTALSAAAAAGTQCTANTSYSMRHVNLSPETKCKHCSQAMH